MKKLRSIFSHLNVARKNLTAGAWSAPYKVEEIMKSRSLFVPTYEELVKNNAQLLYRNRNLTLYYRGQSKDYMDEGSTTILPSIYRKKGEKTLRLKDRFLKLEDSAESLRHAFKESKIKFAGTSLLHKYPEAAWSILQHYGVCDTPLLDITQSLHVACSFVFDKKPSNGRGVVYVIGMPWATDSIGYNSYEELVNVRLLSFCPPQATRPYFQEGYLAGTFPNYKLDDPSRIKQFDFGRRLIAKFEIPTDPTFWGKGFGRIPTKMLYHPDDRIQDLCECLPAFATSNL